MENIFHIFVATKPITTIYIVTYIFNFFKILLGTMGFYRLNQLLGKLLFLNFINFIGNNNVFKIFKNFPSPFGSCNNLFYS